jgi:hypothetical protein
MNVDSLLIFFGLSLVAACGGRSVYNGPDAGSASSGAAPAPAVTPAEPPPACTQDGACSVSFALDIMPFMGSHDGYTGCAARGCHDTQDPFPPAFALSPDDPRADWQTLVSHRDANGRAYVVPCKETAGDGYMACNLRYDPTCGRPMPIGHKMKPAELALFDTWLACGAPFN